VLLFAEKPDALAKGLIIEIHGISLL